MITTKWICWTKPLHTTKNSRNKKRQMKQKKGILRWMDFMTTSVPPQPLSQSHIYTDTWKVFFLWNPVSLVHWYKTFCCIHANPLSNSLSEIHLPKSHFFQKQPWEVLPLQIENAAQVSVQSNASYKCRGIIWICIRKETEVQTRINMGFGIWEEL